MKCKVSSRSGQLGERGALQMALQLPQFLLRVESKGLGAPAADISDYPRRGPSPAALMGHQERSGFL